LLREVQIGNGAAARNTMEKSPTQKGLLDSELILGIFSMDRYTAVKRLKEFNEEQNEDTNKKLTKRSEG